MECNQQQTSVAATKTLYENFIEEKCESDLLIPDYFPAAEKILQCNAVPVILKKDIEGDRLNLEGSCRFTVIYRGEETEEIKSLTETVVFSESFPLKEVGNNPWAQAMVRVSGTSCRLLNPRKISARATVSVALKVKDQHWTETIEEIDCNEAEALFMSKNVYTVLEHTADTAKVQGEIEVHTEVQDVLKTDGSVCIKDIKHLPGKVLLKGVVDLYVLFTPESNPAKVECTSTAIPFNQVLDVGEQQEEGTVEVSSYIQNIRTDVESDDEGKNRLISISVTLLTEGELYENKAHRLLTDVYSNRYPLEIRREQICMEEMTEQCTVTETCRHELRMDGENIEVLQALGTPIVQKVTGQDKTLSIEGILDVSLFLREGEEYRGADKVLHFTLKAELKQLNGRMRCETRPCVLGMDWSVNGENIELKTELACSLMIFSKETHEVIGNVEVDVEHPLEQARHKPLVVYYAEKGERLWDIARKYATTVAAIKSVNDVERDVLEDRRLLLISGS